MENINKNIIMQAGAAVANATNKAAGLSASTPEPGSIISVIQLVNGGRTIGPDALAHFTESVRNKLLSLLVSMEPIQDFNGYDHPWPGGGGVNLVDPNMTIYKRYLRDAGGSYDWAYSDDSASIAIKADPETAYTLSRYLTTGGIYRVSTIRVSSLPSESDTTDIPTYQNVRETTASGFGSTRTITTDANATYVVIQFNGPTIRDFVVNGQFERGSTATEYSPYENVCPITGRTGLHVYAGPTSAIGDATTYSMDWTSPAGTVYAGSADIVSGDIKAAPYYASYNGETLVGPWVSSMDVYDPEGTPTTGAQVVDLGGIMTEYHITGQDIITLVGDNYIWSDSGDVTITE